VRLETWNTLQPNERLAKLARENGRGTLLEFDVVSREATQEGYPHIVELRSVDGGSQCIHSIDFESYLIRSGVGSGV